MNSALPCAAIDFRPSEEMIGTRMSGSYFGGFASRKKRAAIRPGGVFRYGQGGGLRALTATVDSFRLVIALPARTDRPEALRSAI